MAGDKTYVTDNNDKLHRATRTKGVTPSDIVWSSNPNDYTVQVLVDGKWHRAVLTYDVQAASFFDNINIDKALIVGDDGKSHTALIVDPVSASVNMSPIPTDDHSTLAGTTTGETALNVYSEEWASVQWQDNVNVYKVLVQGSDGKTHTALLTTSVIGEVEVIVKGTSPLEILDAIADSLIYLKAFGGVEQRNVPEGYQELEYIQGTTNVQYINTGIIPTSDMNMSGKFQFVSTTDSSQGTSFTGARDANTGGTGFYWAYSSTSIIFDWFGSGSSDRYTVSLARQDLDIVEYEIKNSLGTITKNGTLVGTHQFTPVGTTSQPIYLNALNSSGSVAIANLAKNNVYRFTIEGICDLVPAKRLSDNAIGMWDKIRKQFFTNAGTGAFTAGAEVTTPSPTLPRDIWCNNGAVKAIRPIEYLESTGTQYIDTGFKPNNNSGMEIDYSAVRSDRPVIAWCGSPATNTYGFGVSEVAADASIPVWVYNCLDTLQNRWAPTGLYGGGTGRYFVTIDKLNASIKAEDGSVLSHTFPTSTHQIDVSLYLFAANNVGSVYYGQGGCKIYACKLYDNGTLVRDFIPALDANNVPCMFDKVEGKCYYNQGTGQFIAPYLPAEYERLDYIEGTANVQYINTGIIPNSLMSLYSKMQNVSISNPNSTNIFFGARDTTTGGQGIDTGYQPSAIFFDWFGSTGSDRYTFSITRADGDIVEHNVKNSNVEIKVNGTSIGTHQFTPTGTITQPLYVNGLNNAGAPLENTAGINRVYRFTIAGVCDMIPARRISDGEIGMYDTIRRQFFTNAGTGSFTCDSSYTELEYIQSSGTQYIDTGVVGDLNTEYEITVKNNYTYSTNAYAIFGSRTSATENNIMSTFTSSGGNTGIINDFGDYTVTRQNPMRTSAEIMHRYKLTNGKSKRTVTDLDTGWTDTITTEYSGSLTTPTNLYIGYAGSLGGLGNSYNLRGNIYGCKIWKSGALVRDFIPAKRNGDNAIGLYDKVEKKFYTNAGTGVFTAGSEIPTPIDPLPIELMVDGTVEKIKIDTGAEVAICENLFATQTLKDEQEILSGDIVRNVGIAVLTGQENWTTENTWFKADVFTGNSMDNAIVCSHFERGLITQDNTVARSAGTTVMMLHYSACANVAALKSWLASQYNAGTPVIVLYALETATTESVAGQTLTVVEGNNTAEIMQASIDDLELEVKYIKVA